MFVYSNSTGNHLCAGMEDMRKADGFPTNYANRVITDEEGQIVAVSGGSMSLEKSEPLIKAMREDILMKSQKQAATLKKSFKQAKPLHRTTAQQASASRDTKHAFDGLLRELDDMKHTQKQFMTKVWS